MARHVLAVEAVRDRAAARGDCTAVAIAHRIGAQPSTVSRLMSHQTVPTVETLVALRSAYGLALDELVESQSRAEVGVTA